MKVLVCTTLIFLATGCVYEQIKPLGPPPPPKETSQFELAKTQSIPNTVNANAWNYVDFVIPSVSDVVTGEVGAEDGLFNISGTYNGLTDFNGGEDPELILRGLYDDEYIYILAEWKDGTHNADNRHWVYNGKPDPLKAGSTDGWTSQRSNDKIEIEFPIDQNSTDIWQWNLALSAPMGFAIDMFDYGVPSVDTGDKLFYPNMAGSDLRSGPMYEWDGTSQEYVRGIGGLTLLDPRYFLSEKLAFQGDINAGETVYQNECARCHGVGGDGDGYEWNTGKALNKPGEWNTTPRTGFEARIGSDNHSGKSYWDGLTSVEKNDIITRMRGFSGVPGYYLENQNGATSDIQTASNVIFGNLPSENTSGYKVLFVRKLNTGSTEDIQFDPSLVYQLRINLYDNDELNKVGTALINMEFK